MATRRADQKRTFAAHYMYMKDAGLSRLFQVLLSLAQNLVRAQRGVAPIQHRWKILSLSVLYDVLSKRPDWGKSDL